MKKTMVVVSAALASVFLLPGPATAQGTSQTVEIAKVDVQKLSVGYRASKVIGSNVLNDANDTIGKIDDLLSVPTARRHLLCYRSVASSVWVPTWLSFLTRV
jgi:hypothetical protein